MGCRARRSRRLAAAVAALAGLVGCAPGEAPAADPEEPAPHVALDAGVTEEPCPAAVNPGNGCVYLGTISDLSERPTEPFARDFMQAQEAFWARVNEAGGVGGHDVDVTTHVVDRGDGPPAHADAYEEVAGEVLALAQVRGAETTDAVRDRMASDSMLGIPASTLSRYAWNEMLLSSGASSCVQGMNAVDAAAEAFAATSVLAVHDPGDAGADSAAGARIAAGAHDLPFDAVPLDPGGDAVEQVADEVVDSDPGVVVLAVGPAETAALVARAAAEGFTGAFVGTAQSFHPALLDGPAAEPLTAFYLLAGPWAPWDADTPGHAAMREWVDGRVDELVPTPAHTAGWVSQYPLLAALESAAEGELSRTALRDAARALPVAVDEGMGPPDAVGSPGGVGHRVVREVVLAQPDPDAPDGLRAARTHFAGPTAGAHPFGEPCG